MKAIAICGSPRKRGNTELLLDRCVTKLREAGSTPSSSPSVTRSCPRARDAARAGSSRTAPASRRR